MIAWGFQTAVGEITLVTFTTLAPSSVMALMVMSGILLFAHLSNEERMRINTFMIIPLVLSMIGLVASATHLGNPDNALYVFTGVGRSPLSNEVFSAVVFLAFSGIYWLYSFSENPNLPFQKVWLTCIIISGAGFITGIAFAYSESTIVSWYSAYVPVNLWLNALVGGPTLALLSFQVARYDRIRGLLGKVLCAISGVAIILNTISFALQDSTLPSMENSFTTAAELVPYYGVGVGAFAILGLCSLTIWGRLVWGKGRRQGIVPGIVANILVFTGIFVMRFLFYMMHMTTGVGI